MSVTISIVAMATAIVVVALAVGSVLRKGVAATLNLKRPVSMSLVFSDREEEKKNRALV